MKYICLLTLLCLMIMPVHAQETLQLGENVMGKVTPQNAAPTYSFTSEKNAPLKITVRATTADFHPVILLYDETYNLIKRERNPAGTAQLDLIFTPETGKTYLVQIVGVDGEHGEFILGLIASDIPPVQPVALETSLSESVSPDAPLKIYQFESNPDSALLLQVVADNMPAVMLVDANDNPLGVIYSQLDGGTFIIPAARGVIYRVIVRHSGADQTENYTIAINPLAAVEISTTAPTVPADANGQVIIPFTGECQVATLGEEPVNIREEPDPESERISSLQVNVLVRVSGRTEDNMWWQVEYRPGSFGWVSASVVRRGGDCSDIIIIVDEE